MKNRLLRILQEENMTSNKFAELMEVRPSNISHLLAGRNYPNFEFVGRMLLRFPNLNPDWLINANGDIYRDGQKDLFGLERESQIRVQDINKELQFVVSDDRVVDQDSAIEDEIDNLYENENLSVKEEVISPQIQTKDIQSIENKQIESVINEPIHNQYLEKPVRACQEIEEQVYPSEQIISKNVSDDIDGDQIDKIMIFYKDKTFDTYTSR